MDPRMATSDPYLTQSDIRVLSAIYSLHVVAAPSTVVPMTSEAIASLAECDAPTVERAWVRISSSGYAGRFRREDGPIDYRCQHSDKSMQLRPPPDGPCPCEVLPAMAALLDLDDHAGITYAVVLDHADEQETEARESLIDYLGGRQPQYGLTTDSDSDFAPHRYLAEGQVCRECDQPRAAEIHRLR